MTDLIETLLKELDAEMASTRRLLERVPGDKLDWKPHAKSRTMGELATHITELPRWGLRVEKDSWQVGSEKAPPMKTTGEFLARFDENTAAARAAIAKKTDEQLLGEFTVLKPDGSVFFKLSRRSAMRRVLLSHLIHHRGQLTVYLRLNDVPLPAVYGPSADEGI